MWLYCVTVLCFGKFKNRLLLIIQSRLCSSYTWLHPCTWSILRIQHVYDCSVRSGHVLSPVNEAAFSFQAGLVHEHYTLFKVLRPVEHKELLVRIGRDHIKHSKNPARTATTCCYFVFTDSWLTAPVCIYLVVYCCVCFWTWLVKPSYSLSWMDQGGGVCSAQVWEGWYHMSQNRFQMPLRLSVRSNQSIKSEKGMCVFMRV